MSAIVRDEPTTLQAPEALGRLVMRCLRKSKSERFQSMTETRQALEKISAKPGEHKPLSVAKTLPSHGIRDLAL